MFSRTSNAVVVDLLLNLLCNFVALFFLAFIMINASKQEMNTINDNNIIITMKWKADVDIDLWVKLPDERKVWYNNRDEPPAHLDLDVVKSREYQRPDGTWYRIDTNEEVVTIRDVFQGEYAVNVHYYDARETLRPVKVEIIVQDVKHEKIIYAGTKMIELSQPELHFVRFKVDALPGKPGKNELEYRITNTYTDRPTYFVSDMLEYEGY